ncbi:MAG: NUMOD4 motif-containing HNH endonuclease [Selenomonadaceae bacterium]|nr:NUMOD4 motif-containing HNH endonuclease [Selenomonadaceae bacterium]
MTVEEATKILMDGFPSFSPEVQNATNTILSALKKIEKDFSELKENVFGVVLNLPSEIWRDVKDFEGIYQVSNLGRVKSFYGKEPRILKPGEHWNGYLGVVLFKNDHRKTYSVHRLIAEAFIPNPENKSMVNHKDGNKQNNCLENLEWATRSENVLHAHKIGLVKNKRCEKALTDEQVRYIRKNYKIGDRKFGQQALAKKFKVAPHVIQCVVTEKTYKNVH